MHITFSSPATDNGQRTKFLSLPFPCAIGAEINYDESLIVSKYCARVDNDPLLIWGLISGEIRAVDASLSPEHSHLKICALLLRARVKYSCVHLWCVRQARIVVYMVSQWIHREIKNGVWLLFLYWRPWRKRRDTNYRKIRGCSFIIWNRRISAGCVVVPRNAPALVPPSLSAGGEFVFKSVGMHHLTESKSAPGTWRARKHKDFCFVNNQKHHFHFYFFFTPCGWTIFPFELHGCGQCSSEKGEWIAMRSLCPVHYSRKRDFVYACARGPTSVETAFMKNKYGSPLSPFFYGWKLLCGRRVEKIIWPWAAAAFWRSARSGLAPFSWCCCT